MNWSSFLIGAASSVAVLFLTFLCRDVLWPFVKSKLTDVEGINISGKWVSNFDSGDGENIEAVFTLHQTGVIIKGEEDGRIEHQDGSHIEHEKYTVSGECKDGFVFINSVNTSKSELGRLLLLLRASGKEMHGLGIWYSVRRNSIVSRDMHLIRCKDES